MLKNFATEPLCIYESSSKDSYRADKNNKKDIRKIDFLKNMIYND